MAWGRSGAMMRLGMSAIAALACAQAAPGSGVPPGAGGAATGARLQFRALTLLHEEPRRSVLRFELEAATRQLVRHERVLKSDCPQHWERRCWDETSSRHTVTPHQLDRIASAMAEVRTADAVAPPAPGASHVALAVDLGDSGVRRASSTARRPDPSVLRVEALLAESAAGP
jgi:hypothetical protein